MSPNAALMAAVIAMVLPLVLLLVWAEAYLGMEWVE